MKNKSLSLGGVVLMFTVLGWARSAPQPVPYPQDEKQTWTGVVSDSHCGAKHSEASAEAATCVSHCVSQDGKYVLVSEGKVYQLDPQEKFSDLAGKAVEVTGTLNEDSISVESVEAQKADSDE